MLIFDIETGPLPEETLLQFADEFVPPPHPGEFDASAVKVGNLKDAAKIQQKIDDARAAHACAVAEHDANCITAQLAWRQSLIEKAALSPITGCVLAIGFRATETGKAAIEDGKGDEAEVLNSFWRQYLKSRNTNRKMVGCNIASFDLPFLVRRSWILGVDVPASAIVQRRYFDQLFVDLRDVWLLGQRWTDCPSSLDLMARALGCGCKPADVGGGDFARLWNGTHEEKQQAVAYLLNDLDMTAQVAERLGVM